MSILKYRLLGYTHVKFGDVDTELTNPVEIADIVPDSIVLTIEEPDVTDIFVEGSDDPDIQILAGTQKKTITFQTREMKPANLILALGGATVAGSEVKVENKTDIAFVDNGASADTITSVAADFGSFAAGDKITVSGSVSNDGAFTIGSVVAATITLITSDKVSDEAASASISIVSGGQGWSSPVVATLGSKSLQIKGSAVDAFHIQIDCAKVSVAGSMDGRFQKTDTGVITYTCTILEPASLKALKIVPVAA